MMDFSVRRLTSEDAEAYRVLRSQALEYSPHAFGDSIEEANSRPDEAWIRLLSGGSDYFGVFEQTKLVGCANCSRERSLKTKHKGWLYGVYVDPSARGRGASDLLISTILSFAKQQGLSQLHLGVGTLNSPAMKLYERFGFATYGTEPRALLVEGQFIDEHHMVCFLDKEDF